MEIQLYIYFLNKHNRKKKTENRNNILALTITWTFLKNVTDTKKADIQLFDHEKAFSTYFAGIFVTISFLFEKGEREGEEDEILQ